MQNRRAEISLPRDLFPRERNAMGRGNGSGSFKPRGLAARPRWGEADSLSFNGHIVAAGFIPADGIHSRGRMEV